MIDKTADQDAMVDLFTNTFTPGVLRDKAAQSIINGSMPLSKEAALNLQFAKRPT